MYTMKDQKLIDAICDLYREGNSMAAVAEASGVCRPTVAKIVKEHGLTRQKGYRSTKPTLAAAITERTCQSCGCGKHMAGAQFCYICGAALATQQELAQKAAARVSEFFEPYRSGNITGMEDVLAAVDAVAEYINREAC